MSAHLVGDGRQFDQEGAMEVAKTGVFVNRGSFVPGIFVCVEIMLFHTVKIKKGTTRSHSLFIN